MAGGVQVGNIVYQVEMDVQRLITSQRELDLRLGRVESGFNNTSRAVQGTERSMFNLSRVATSLFAILSAQKVIQYADTWTYASNKMIGVIGDAGDLAASMNKIVQISNDTQTSISTTTTLFTRMAAATKSLGVSEQDLYTVTKAINQSLSLSGATAAETDSAITQLTQGLNRGYLGGQDFNSVVAAAPRLIKALADYTGKSTAELKEMGGAGQLTSEIILQGVKAAADGIDKEFAKATVSFAQHMTVAENNLTKFIGESASVKETLRVVSSVVITASEHLDVLSAAMIAASVAMGGRFVGALALAATAQAKQVKDTLTQIVATRTRAREDLAAAAVTARKAAADKSAALSALNLAQAEYNVAKGSAAEATAMANLIRLRTAYTQAAAIAAQANNALAASQARVATTGAMVKNFFRDLNALTAPLGGLVGAFTLVAGAIYYFYQKSQQAKQEALEFADGLDQLKESLASMNQAQLEGNKAKLEESITAQKEAINDLRNEVDSTARAMADYQAKMEKYAGNHLMYTQAERGFAQAQRDNQKATAALDSASLKLKTSQESLASVTTLLTEKFSLGAQAANALAQAIDLVAGKSSALAPTGDDAKNLAESMSEAADKLAVAKLEAAGNSEQAAILAAAQKLAASSSDEFGAAVLRLATNQATATDIANKNLDGVREYLALVGKLFTTQQAARKAKKESGGGSKTDQAAESIKRLSQQLEVAKLEAEGLAREAAILSSVQSLDAKATPAQIAAIKARAGALFDLKKHQDDLNAAIQNDPIRKENQAYKESAEQLKRQLATQIIDQQAYDKQAEQLALNHQIAMAQIQAEAVVTPQQQALAMVDPLQREQNEYAQRLALVQAFEQQKLITTEQASLARQRILDEENAKQNQALSDILGAASQGFDGIAGVIEASGGKTSAAYKVLFGISKGFAVAQAALNLQTAISNAMALPWPTNIPAIAQAVAAGAQVTSAISSINYGGGRKSGGPVSAGNLYEFGEGNLPELLQMGGKNYLLPGNNGSVISNKDLAYGIPKASTGREYINGNAGSDSTSTNGGKQESEPSFTVIIEHHGTPFNVMDEQREKGLNGQDVIRLVTESIQQGTYVGQAIEYYHQAPRKARQ